MPPEVKVVAKLAGAAVAKSGEKENAKQPKAPKLPKLPPGLGQVALVHTSLPPEWRLNPDAAYTQLSFPQCDLSKLPKDLKDGQGRLAAPSGPEQKYALPPDLQPDDLDRDAEERAKAEGKPPPKVDAGRVRHEIMFSGTPFKGQLIAMHKLKDRQALCWARHGECHPRCACYCACPDLRSRARECAEPDGSTCNFDCPSAAELEEVLAGNSSFARTLQEREPERHAADGIICRAT